MVGNRPDDEYGDFDSFDFAADAISDDHVSDLDALADLYAIPEPDSAVGAPPPPPSNPEVEPYPLFTVTNPPETVTVSATIDGRTYRIELSPDAPAVGEERLAAEIVVIAGLATQQARSAQFSYMLEGMQNHGHDHVDTREFLSRNVGLPSPEEADAARAQIFATRYAGEHD